METVPRHQCLIYEGAPSRHLLSIAAVMRQKLNQGDRCLYLNSVPMVAGIRSYLAAAGVEVESEVAKGSLVFSSDQQSNANGRFDPVRMIETLERLVEQALKDGYAGLWASGDMAWEFGFAKDFTGLLEYEWQLEELFQRQPALSGICQYHSDTLPREAMRHGLVVHPSIFINETLALVNPHYVHRELFSESAAQDAVVDSAITRFCHSRNA